MERAVINALSDLASTDPDLVYLSADNGTEYDFLFSRQFPGRFYSVGIAESNMVGMASGLAEMGKHPVIISAAPFLAYRAYEFIRNDLCLQDLPVVVLATGSGLSVSMLGPTHHATEDIAALRAIPNLVILSPADAIESEEAIKFAYGLHKPVYVRLGVGGEERIYGDGRECDSAMFTNSMLREGDEVLMFGTGSMVAIALQIAEVLDKSNGIDACVVDVRSLSPFDSSQLREFSAKPIITLEEHGVIGGLGAIVTDALAMQGITASVLKVGLRDGFAKGYGTPEELRLLNGLDSESIQDTIVSFL